VIRKSSGPVAALPSSTTRSIVPTASKTREMIRASWLAELISAMVMGNIATTARAHRVRRANASAAKLTREAATAFAPRAR
jgi:hypothetical protein